MTHRPPTRLSDTPFAIETHGLSKRYGKQVALHDVALQVPEGAVYLLVGPNGAGKSTTLKLLLDFIRPTAGSATIFGLDVHRDGPRVRANIGYVPETAEWGYPWMRVEQLFDYHARFYPSWDPAYAAQLSKQFQLRLTTQLGKLSKGQIRRVHLAMALVHRPPLLVLDEATDGLDPMMRDETLGILSGHIAEHPTTVFMSTHHVEEVERLADHIGVLQEGVLRAQLPISELHRNLRRYHATIPPTWAGIPGLNGTVLRKTETPNDVQWIVWGDPTEITQQFVLANATVVDVSPVSMLDATVSLLTFQPPAS